MSFWDIVWFIIISFAFVAYLMVLFSIIGDLFRDRETSGWVKALWIIALIVVPFLSAFIYIVARGNGMTERRMAELAVQRQQTDAYIREVAGSASAIPAQSTPADQIAQAQKMLDQGVISQPEYDRLKAKALA
jgi:Phospholipase_D-nuclease N-terminal